MKRFILFFAAFMCVCVLNAQDVVDDFNVGPYEVFYKGKGDVDYRLKKGIDLYDFFGLKKDTIIQINTVKPEPFINGFQLAFYGEAGTNRDSKNSLSYRLEGVWKQKIANDWYFNGGLSLGIATAAINNVKDNILEFGAPLSIEWTKLNRKEASLYVGLGITPAYYSITDKDGIFPKKNDEDINYSGIYIAPSIDLGGYIPVGKQIIKVGVTWRHKNNLSTKDYDLYDQGVGKSFFGANIGVIF